MPQMSPLMWFSLFILFSMALIMFNQMIFFSFKVNKILFNKKESNKNYQLNWKW
uniref:ATP synthase complex subunit 8 n=1 Tax=Sphenarium purpurascens TaxID=1603978 RepID=A0A516IMW3_9ORTH|nr:ATP synthase F0 subunit 8 [Sphenarium purpurascens]